MEVKKIYVTSGTLRWVGMASGPIDAIRKALNAHGCRKAKPLDDTYVFLDEQGHRTHDARYKVPVEQALAEAGYISDGNAGGVSLSNDPSPLAEE
jgi:hypothetical protein